MVTVGVPIQRFALDQLHREVGLGAVHSLGVPRLVDLGDPGVLQPAEDLRFAGEAAYQSAGLARGFTHSRKGMAFGATGKC